VEKIDEVKWIILCLKILDRVGSHEALCKRAQEERGLVGPREITAPVPFPPFCPFGPSK